MRRPHAEAPGAGAGNLLDAPLPGRQGRLHLSSRANGRASIFTILALGCFALLFGVRSLPNAIRIASGPTQLKLEPAPCTCVPATCTPAVSATQQAKISRAPTETAVSTKTGPVALVQATVPERQSVPEATTGTTASAPTPTSPPTTIPSLTDSPPTPAPSPSFRLLRNPSDFRCEELAPSGSVDVLGRGYGTFHYCVLTHACVTRDELLLWNESRAGTYSFPRVMFWPDKFRTRILNDRDAAAQSVDSPPDQFTGTSLLLGHAYCCRHPTHFLEPIGAVQAAFAKLYRAGCEPARLDCVDGIRRVFELSRGGLGRWPNLVGRAAFNDSHLDDAAEWMDWNRPGLVCFDKLLVPGAYYEVWPSLQYGTAFAAQLQRWLSAEKLVKQEADGWIRSYEKPEGYQRDPNTKSILYSIRRATRRVVDEAALIPFLEFVMQRFDGGLLRTINFGEHSPLSQAAHSQDTDILVGIHGADLTNLIFLPRGAAVVELNPFLFFEPRFYLMAEKLDLRYHAWTCTARECAFGGDHFAFDSHFEQLAGFYTFNASSREIHSVEENSTFRWPFDVYQAPGVCHGCNHMLCCSAKSSVNWLSRDSNIAIMPVIDELMLVLARIFVAKGWVNAPSDTANGTTSAEQVARTFAHEVIAQWKASQAA